MGTTPSIQDGRRKLWGLPGGVTASVESIGEEELLVVSFKDLVLDGLESLDLNPPPPTSLLLETKMAANPVPLGFLTFASG